MFQFRRFPPYTYLIQCMVPEYCSGGFPHSEICGSKIICISPQLIAAYHVFRRLPVPRHSPCALSSLTVPYRLSTISAFQILHLPTRFNQNCSFNCFSFRSFCLRLRRSASARNRKDVLESPKVDCLYSAFASYKREQASQLVGASRLESLNALMAYTSYKRVSCLSSFIATGGLKWTRTTDLALIRRAL